MFVSNKRQTADYFVPKFGVATHMTPGKMYGWTKSKNVARTFITLKMHQFKVWTQKWEKICFDERTIKNGDRKPKLIISEVQVYSL